MPASADRPREAQSADHRRRFNRELRAAFLAGAEERSIREQGSGLSETELKAVLRRYPGDLPEGDGANR